MSFRMPRVTLVRAGVDKAFRLHPDRNFSRQRLADRLDIRPDLLSHYTSGNRTIGLDQAVRMADLLRVPLREITADGEDVCLSCGRPFVEAAA